MLVISSGNRFGLLTAISELNCLGKRKWTCQCDCGEETVAEATKLRTGHKRSCGCLRSNPEMLLKATKAAATANKKPIIGLRFGRLIALIEGPNYRFTCKCDCGMETQVARNSLISGDTKSCGCLQSERAKVLAEDRAKRQRINAGHPENTPISADNRIQRNKFRELSAIIKRRDKYTCVLCLNRGVRLNVHHIERWSDSPNLRFDEKNLVTLCRGCHIGKAHNGNVHRATNPEVAKVLKQYVLGL